MTWCTQQLNALVGNADLTLVQFCMTLKDNAEIREYIRTYLVRPRRRYLALLPALLLPRAVHSSPA